MNKSNIIIAVVVVLGLSALTAYVNRDRLYRYFFRPTESSLEQGILSGRETDDVSVVADNLTVPWEIAFLPNGDALVTERSGTVKRIEGNDKQYPIEGVEHKGEGGLLGLAVHPDFKENKWLYLYLTTRKEKGLINRVERYTYEDDRLSGKVTVVESIPGALIHDGGRIAFGPDGKLYITTGDAGSPDRAQETSSLAGKILRINDDGSIPEDNPFGNAVYSYGHRNPQGLAWDDKGQLWATEHGSTAQDELNLIKAGANYGWPLITGEQTHDGMESPVAHSGEKETWAPAGMAFYEGSLFFAGLRGQSLYEAKIHSNNDVVLREHFHNEFGRLRAVTFGSDNNLYVSTSNTDGRGSTNSNDDKIIKIHANIFDRTDDTIE